MKLKKNVVMVGMMGAGKTAIGKALAQRIGVAFVDSDAEIEEAAAMSIAEIFSRDGEAFFRRREAEVINRLLSDEPRVISIGGGAYLSADNRAAIDAKGVALWLSADTDLLWSRVKHKTTRPLLQTADPYGTLSKIAEDRNPIYALAPLHVQTRPGLSIEDTTGLVIDALCAKPEVLECA